MTNSLNYLSYFTNKLKSLKPKGDDVPKIITEPYLIDRKKLITNLNQDVSKVLIQLVDNYNADVIKFGDFYFYKKTLLKDNFLIFAESSYSYLILNLDKSSQILEIDKNTLIPLESVAKDSLSFLNALIHIMECYSMKFDESVNISDDQIEKICVEKCIKNAGGEKYRQFYENVLM